MGLAAVEFARGKLGCLTLALAGLFGCRVPGAERIVGPDGSPMLHVHCGHTQSACFKLAGDACPAGYEFRPVFDPQDGNFLVRCRAPARSATNGAPTPFTQIPPPNSSLAALDSADTHPVPEPKPAERTSNAQASASATGRFRETPKSKPLGSVDIGY